MTGHPKRTGERLAWIEELYEHGDSPPTELAQRILALGPEAVRPLVEVVRDVTREEDDEPAATAAVHLLGQLQATAAIEALLDVLRTMGDDARTEYLRGEIGPRLLAVPGVRADRCATVARFERDTGVVVPDCLP